MDSFTLVLLVIIVIVILAFGAVFTIFIIESHKKDKLLIAKGFKDEDIRVEREKQSKTSSKVGRGIVSFVGWVVLLGIVGFCGFSIYTQNVADGFPTGDSFRMLAIQTGSMSEINNGNNYFTYQTDENGQPIKDANGAYIKNSEEQKKALAVNEFDAHALILLRELPAEEDLKVGDIIAYKNSKNQIIIHRLVEIKDPQYENRYVLQGDANAGPDGSFKYSALGAIYKGEHVPGLGAFILYMQSPVGIIVIIMCLYIVILVDIINRQLTKAEDERLAHLKERQRLLYDEDGNLIDIRGLEQEGIYV